MLGFATLNEVKGVDFWSYTNLLLHEQSYDTVHVENPSPSS